MHFRLWLKGEFNCLLERKLKQKYFCSLKGFRLTAFNFSKIHDFITVISNYYNKIAISTNNRLNLFAQVFYISGKKRLKRKSGFLATDTGVTSVPALKVSSRPICREASEHSAWKIYGGCHTTLSLFTFLILILLLTVGKSSF